MSEEEFLKNVDSIASTCQLEIKPSIGKMFQCAVIHTENVDYFIFAASHFVIDGMSWRILMNDMIAISMYVEQGILPKVDSATNNILSYSKYCENLVEESYFDSELHYWNTQCVPYKLTSNNTKVGIYKNKVSFDKLDTKKILTGNSNVESILLSAFALELGKVTSNAEITIFLENHGRIDPNGRFDLSNSVGWFTTIYPIKVNTKNEMFEQIRRISYELTNVPNNGLGFSYLAIDRKNNKLFQCAKDNAKIYFNYLGEMGQESKDGELFKLSDIVISDEMDKDIDINMGIMCNAYIINEQLMIEIICSQQILSIKEVEYLLGNLHDQVLSFILEGIDVEKEELDFINTDIDLDDVDSIIRKINQLK